MYITYLYMINIYVNYKNFEDMKNMIVVWRM